MSDWGEDDYDGIQAQPREPEPTEPPAEEPTLYYGSVDEFVREYLRHVYRRAINGRSRVWAARWWEYDEAVIRLEALWRAWEHLRLVILLCSSSWSGDCVGGVKDPVNLAG